MLSKLSHSIISPSWLLSRQSATLNITPVPWRNTKSEREAARAQLNMLWLSWGNSIGWTTCVCLSKKRHIGTKNPWHKAKWELWGEECEEPRCCVKAWADLVILQVIVQLTVVVMQQSGELVHLNLRGHGECVVALEHIFKDKKNPTTNSSIWICRKEKNAWQ